MRSQLDYSTLDSCLILFLMLAVVLPVDVAKYFVVIANFLIILRILKDKKIRIDKTTLTIFLLILPGILLTLIKSPGDLIRFMIILVLIFKHPFPELKLNKKIIMYFSMTILFYLVSTQILISYRVDALITFRNTWYFSPYTNIFDHETYFNFAQNQSLLDLFGSIRSGGFFGSIRSGGLFHNPNLLGMIVLLFFFILDACYSSLKQKNRKIYLFANLLIITSLLLTFSRTAIGGYLIYHFIKQTNFKKLLFFKISKRSIFIYIFLIIIVINMKEAFLENFITTESSGYLKYSIFANYLKNSDIFTILFGGTHDVFFDAELGNWIGAVGIIGSIGLIILFIRVYKNNKLTLAFFISFIFISIGNTIIYGLLTANLAYVYFLIQNNSIKNNYFYNSK